MKDILQEEKFNFLSEDDKAFILAFDNEMATIGYDFGDTIGSGFCWGKYMIVYRKSGVKSQRVFSRIYLRETSIVLRLFFSKIEKHREYIEQATSHIKEVFVGEYGNCHRCHNEKDGICKFRKIYTLDDRIIEKCNERTFEFQNPSMQNMRDYLALFTEFYPKKNK